MDRSYDKEIGLRELLLQELSDIVDDLILQNEQNPKQVYTEENKYCILLTICLERCITFGMKDSGFFAKRDFFEFIAKGSMHVKDEYLEQDVNSVQQLLLHKTGKARAWIRKTINEYHLARSLYSLASDREFIKSWFEPYAIMSTNAINDLYKEIEKLEQIHFQFNLKDRLLDHDDLFSLAPHQYRGANKLERLRPDTDDSDIEGDESNEHKKRDKKSKRNKKDRKLLKRNKSRRNANLNEINQSTNDEAPLKVETAQNSDHEKTKKNKKRAKKKRKKTKDSDMEQEEEEGDSLHLDIEPDAEHKVRKQSLQEWQQKLDTNSPAKKHFSDPKTSAILTTVSVMKSEPIRITARRKGSISERIQNKLAAIPIKINSNNNMNIKQANGNVPQSNNNAVFRISSPSDYHTSFKWNDAATDNSSQIIEKLYDDEHNEKKRQNFPDPMSYVEQIENEFEDEEIHIMDDKELEQEITTLIENAPNDTNDDDGELSLSSEQDMNTLLCSSSEGSASSASAEETINTIKEEEASQSCSILSDIKKEEILSKNDEYIAAKRIYAPEAQTFIHHIEQTSASDANRLGHHIIGDIAAQPLSIYFQSDNYFDDENALRDSRKQEQDKESKKRMQREQDVMRGNDSVYIQKSLNSSGMKSSGGSDNKPLDCLGNKVVLPSTGIILDETTDCSIDEFFADQNGECFSCGDHLGSPQISRQCCYTQRLYCALCMDGTLTNMIPSKLIHSLDSRRYPISAPSAKHLDSMYDVPAVPLSKIDLPSWYIPSSSANISILKNSPHESDDDDDDINIDDEDSIAVNKINQKNNNNNNELIPNQNEKYYKLIKLGEYLEILSYIKQYFYDNKECDAINATVQNALGRRHYLLDGYQTDKDSFGYFLKIIDQHKDESAAAAHQHHHHQRHHIKASSSASETPSKYRLYGLISMRDIYELFNKDLLSTMQFNQKCITNHIKVCKHCKKRSYGANVQFVTKFADVLQ